MLIETDVHIHSTHSDSSRTVDDVFDFAKKIGLKGISITDHNIPVDEEELRRASERTSIDSIHLLTISHFLISISTRMKEP